MGNQRGRHPASTASTTPRPSTRNWCSARRPRSRSRSARTVPKQGSMGRGFEFGSNQPPHLDGLPRWTASKAALSGSSTRPWRTSCHDDSLRRRRRPDARHAPLGGPLRVRAWGGTRESRLPLRRLCGDSGPRRRATPDRRPRHPLRVGHRPDVRQHLRRCRRCHDRHHGALLDTPSPSTGTRRTPQFNLEPAVTQDP